LTGIRGLGRSRAIGRMGLALLATAAWFVIHPGTGHAAAGAVALWHMNETSGTTMVDSAGNNDGTIVNNVTLGAPGDPAYSGTAYRFTGGGWVTVPSANLTPGSSDFEVSFSLNTTSVPPVPDYDLVRQGVSGGPQYKIELQPNGQVSAGFRGSARGGGIQAGPDLHNGQWHRITVKKTASNIQLTIDGATWTNNVVLGSISNTLPVVIGAHPPGDKYVGRLDEVSIRIGSSGGGNNPPSATPDSYSVGSGSQLTVPTPGVLGNDSDPDGDPITAVLVGGTSHGNLSLNANGSLTYTPNSGFSGQDTFTYKATDASLSSNTVTDTITVTSSGNHPPSVTNPGNRSNAEGDAVTLQIQASDADGDPLTYSATGLPPGLSIGSANGRITGTIAAGASANSPYAVQVHVSDGTATTNVNFNWTVSGQGGGGGGSIAFRSSSSATVLGTQITVPAPSGVASGDVMLAGIAARGGVAISAPSGWSLVDHQVNGTSLTQNVYLRVAGSSEPSSYTWTFASSQPGAAAIGAYSGVDTASPVDVSGGQINPGQKAIIAPSVTTTVASDWLVGFFGTARNDTFTPDPAMTERIESVRNSVANSIEDQSLTTAGPTGTRTAKTGSGAPNIGQVVALRPQ